MEIEVREIFNAHGRRKIWNKKSDVYYYHREDGPAIMWDDGYERWYYYNKLYSSEIMPLNLFLAYCKWEYKKSNGD